jgi:hypothetical protein
MIQRISILIIAGVLFSINLSAQNDKDQKDKGINTKQATPVKIIESLPGVWKTNKIYQGSKDVTQTDTLELNKVIEFGREARYVIRMGNEKIDSGAYRVNEDHGTLYLESVSTKKAIEWNVQFKNGTMTLQNKVNSSPSAENRKYVYSRVAAAQKQ